MSWAVNLLTPARGSDFPEAIDDAPTIPGEDALDETALAQVKVGRKLAKQIVASGSVGEDAASFTAHLAGHAQAEEPTAGAELSVRVVQV